jgi:hypothetical protein
MESNQRGAGRPRKADSEKVVVTGVSLMPSWGAFARELGDGNVSRGIQIALREAQVRRKGHSPKKPAGRVASSSTGRR